jgi:3-(3-hydroxy-phenyl)propionate hydroxylase
MTYACDVLIVGAGPTGATLGLLLSRAGVDVIIVEREADIYPLPRAAHIDHEAMRVLQGVGVAEAAMGTSRAAGRYDFLTAAGEVLLRFDGGDRLGAGGWPGGNMIHQPSIEKALREAITSAPRAVLRPRWTFAAFEEEGDGIRSRIETPEGAVDIVSRFLVGADGARSPVRNAADIEIDDLGFDEPWLVIDALVNDASRLPDINLQICDPARPTTCVKMGAGRHRWEFMLLPGETAEQALDDAFIAARLAPWNVEGAVSLERKAVYRFNARVAKSWRKGRVLLAGDAAHQMPPFAGQGLCSGLRDAANLAWKLAAIKSGAGEGILDTYQAEREPNVRAIIAMSMMMGRTVCIIDPDAAAARDAQMLAARASGGAPDAPRYPAIERGLILERAPGAGGYFPQAVNTDATPPRLDDFLGPGAWLVHRGGKACDPGVAGLRYVLTSTLPPAFAAPIEAWLSEREVEAVLVRPDRYVFAGGDPTLLGDAWTQAVTARRNAPGETEQGRTRR